MTAFAIVYLTCDQPGGCEVEYRCGSSELARTRRLAQSEGQWQFRGTHDYCPEHARQSTVEAHR